MRQLEVDAPEVQVTRRVYRSGEGEYLINRQPCRLRDIRDLFAGQGVAGGAYSIIEQGKVDSLLQSSPQQRRLIFEEAAGISRFKQKRVESIRRLERVEQNLLRLSDIVDELGSRLRSVRMQAGKAQKYKERSDRLRDLRTQVGLADWRELTDKLRKLDAEVAAAGKPVPIAPTAFGPGRRVAQGVGKQADAIQQQIQQSASRAAAARERIAQCDSTRSSQMARSDELLMESDRLQRQLLSMTSRVGDSQQLVAETTRQLDEAEGQFAGQQGRLQGQQAELQEAKQQLADTRRQLDGWRSEHTDAVRKVALLDNQIHVLQSQQTSAQAAVERYTAALEELNSTRETHAEQLAGATAQVDRLSPAVEKSAAALHTAEKNLRMARKQLSQSQKTVADLQGRLTGARERANVLEELERRLDGLSAGVKEVIRRSQEDPNGPFGQVRGVVADLLHVDVDMAPLVEVALSERANYLVVTQTTALVEELLREENLLAGRTGFLRLDVPAPASAVDRVDLSAEPGG